MCLTKYKKRMVVGLCDDMGMNESTMLSFNSDDNSIMLTKNENYVATILGDELQVTDGAPVRFFPRNEVHQSQTMWIVLKAKGQKVIRQ